MVEPISIGAAIWAAVKAAWAWWAKGKIAMGIKFALAAATLGFSIAGFFGSREKIEKESPTYGWGGIQTPSVADIPVAVIYGQHKVGGNIIAAYNTRRDLKLLVALGEGQIDSISDIRINDNPIGNLPGASYVFRDGSNTQSVIPGYEESVVQTAHTNWVLNSNNATFTYTTSGSIDAFEVMLVYPNGHYRISERDGKPRAYAAWYEVAYRKQGAPTWTTQLYQDGGYTFNPDYKYYRVDVSGDPGVYEIRVTRKSTCPDVEWNSQYHSSRLRWDATKEITYDGFTYPNTPLLAVTIPATEKISGGIPGVTCVAKGIKVAANGAYWTSGWTQNAAKCLYDLLINSRYGLGGKISAADIDGASFDTAADYCDDLVDDGNGGTEARAQLDLVIDTQMSAQDAIQTILATFGGRLAWKGSKLYLMVDKVETPAQSFDDTPRPAGLDNIIVDSLSYSYQPLDRVPNLIEVDYYDRDEDYRRMTLQVGDESAFIAGTAMRKHRVSALGVSRKSQAIRMGHMAMNYASYGDMLCELQAGMRDVECEAGDVIDITFSHASWTAKKFRVMEIRRSEAFRLKLICRSYDDNMYDFTGIVVDAQPANELPGTASVPLSVENLAVASNENPPGLIVSFTPPLEDTRTGGPQNYDPYWAYALIYIRRASDTWRLHGTDTDGVFYLIPGAELVPGDSYELKVQSVSHDGVRENFDAAPTVTAAFDPTFIVPPDVRGLEIEGQGNNTVFSGRDCKFAWRHVSGASGIGSTTLGDEPLGSGQGSVDPFFQDYCVAIYVNSVEVRREYVVNNHYVYTYEKNAEDNKTIDGSPNPQRAFTIKVWARYVWNNLSTVPATLAVSNPQPAAPASITVTPIFHNIFVEWAEVVDADLQGYELHASTSPGFTPDDTTLISRSLANFGAIPVDPNFARAIRVGAYDAFDDQNINYTTEVLATAEQVESSDLENGAVTTVKIADLAVDSAKIAAAAIVNAKIADAAITSAKIDDLAVQTAKIADLAVDTLQIAGQAVDYLKRQTTYQGSQGVGTGITTITVTHSLGTRVMVTVATSGAMPLKWAVHAMTVNQFKISVDMLAATTVYWDYW